MKKKTLKTVVELGIFCLTAAACTTTGNGYNNNSNNIPNYDPVNESITEEVWDYYFNKNNFAKNIY